MEQLHFLLVPLPSQSHIIPLTDFAISLALRGAWVSIVTTPLNLARFKPSIHTNLKIQLIPIRFPCREAGLPDGCENMDTITSAGLGGKFFEACEMLETPLERVIGEMERKPSCIVSTSAVGWTYKVAHKFNIPGYLFETVSCFTLTCGHKLKLLEDSESKSESKKFVVPDVPDRVEFTKAQIPEKRRNSDADSDGFMKRVLEQVRQSRDAARATLVNSFQDLEPWYYDFWRKEMGKVWCVGPVFHYNRQVLPMHKNAQTILADRGNKAAIDEHDCLNWLNTMDINSVIYVCFGSLCRISTPQLKQIGLGLEKSNHPFIWVMKTLNSTPEFESWLLEEGYEERVQGRGLVIRGWASQMMILNHVAIGGFLTHCGWNSSLEGICVGKPMLTWPLFADQFYNEKLIVDILKIGVRVGAQKAEDYIEWEEVKIGVEKLMDQTEGAIARRRKAAELAKMADRAIEKGGSSYLNLSLFIQDVLEQTQ